MRPTLRSKAWPGPSGSGLRAARVACLLLLGCAHRDGASVPVPPAPSPATAPPPPSSTAAAAAPPAPAADVPGRVSWSLAPPPGAPSRVVGPIYSFAPSISTDGRLVAVLVEESDADTESFSDQDLIVKATEDDRVVKRFPLSRVWKDGDSQALSRLESGEVDRLVTRYGGRAEQANAWLARHAWRELAGLACEHPDSTASDDAVCTAEHAPGCVLEYRAPRYTEPGFVVSPRLVVRRRGGPVVVDFTGKSWPHRSADRRCWTHNQASGGPDWYDATTGVVVAELQFRGGHTGCLAPMPDLHVVRFPPAACR